MDIMNIDETTYNYLFEIDDIKRAYFIYIKQRNNIMNNKKLIKDNKKSIQRRIERLMDDFKSTAKRIILRTNINTTEDYSKALNTLIVTNEKILEILQKSKKRKKYKFNKIGKNFKEVEKYINAHSGLSILLYNRNTTIVLLLLLILTGGEFALACFTKDMNSLMSALLTIMAVLVALLIFHKKIENLLDIDTTQRIISKHTYVKTQKLNLINKTVNNLVRTIIK